MLSVPGGRTSWPRLSQRILAPATINSSCSATLLHRAAGGSFQGRNLPFPHLLATPQLPSPGRGVRQGGQHPDPDLAQPLGLQSGPSVPLAGVKGRHGALTDLVTAVSCEPGSTHGTQQVLHADCWTSEPPEGLLALGSMRRSREKWGKACHRQG